MSTNTESQKKTKRKICENAEELIYEDRMHVLQILKHQLGANKIIEHADGCRINLDPLDYEIIKKLDYIISSRIITSKRHEI